ncbi:hypothetical protein [Gilvibacter sp.]|uniref:hypothetical protein n=1 Tax=Gilvibacter sp. TaxID=2729997 RepID=UPI003F49CA9E
MRIIAFIFFLIAPMLVFAQDPENDSFAPPPGEYIASAWIKDNVSAQTTDYSGFIRISTVPPSSSGPVVIAQAEEASIIDGWVRVIGRFTIPEGVTSFSLELVPSATGSYFDDVRVLPFNGSMKSFVYDPLTQRLMAELDENNYATFYEYDNEGGLIRVKKETERGVYTVQETRSSSSKTSN